MLPRLDTDFVLAPAKPYLPAMKSASLMPSVDATRPCTFTDAPLPNRMPFGLTRNTWPLARRLPRMVDGPEPVTRFSATELASGCTNTTDSPLPMLKFCQLMAAFWLPWVTVTLEPLVLIVAEPADPVPPVGLASASVPHANSVAAASVFSAKPAAPCSAPDTPSDPEPPGARAASETAT